MKRGDVGPAVVMLQQALLELGEPLPKWGADGDLGDETLAAALNLFVEHDRMDHGHPPLGVLTDSDIAFIQQLQASVRAHRNAAIDAESRFHPESPTLVDRRPFTGLNKDLGPRPWSKVKGWCLHQTACNLHASIHLDRCDNVGAHWVVYPDGRKFQLHNIDRIIIHGNGWNNQTIGIEIDGLFAGVEGNDATVWDDPSTKYKERAGSVTTAQILAVEDIIRYDYNIIKSHGGTPTVIVAHRQASRDRRNDPGSKVWKSIALPMIAELKLSDGGPGFALSDGNGGRPIPEEWDPTRKGFPY
jgi:hypothetical protein